MISICFLYADASSTVIYTLSLHDALPILCLALLREHAEVAGLRKGFGVADEQYQKVILGRLHVPQARDRKSTRLNSSHITISYAVFCLKKKKDSCGGLEYCFAQFNIDCRQ